MHKKIFLLLACIINIALSGAQDKQSHIKALGEALPPKVLQKIVLDYLSDDLIKIHTFKMKTDVSSLAFSPDSKVLAFTDHKQTELWHIQPEIKQLQAIPLFEGWGAYVKSFLIDMGAMPLAFSSDGLYLATKKSPKSVQIWEKENDKYVRKQVLETPMGISWFTFSPLVNYFAEGHYMNFTTLWRISNKLFQMNETIISTYWGKLPPEIINYIISRESEAAQNGVHALTFSPTGKYLALGMHNKVKIFQYYDPEKSHHIVIPAEEMKNFGSEPRYRYIEDLVDETTRERNFTVTRDKINLAEVPHPTAFASHWNFIRSIAFSPDGTLLATVADSENNVKLWKLNKNTFELHTSLEIPKDIKMVAFSPDGNRLAVCSNNTIQVWDIANKKQIYSLEFPDTVNAIAYSRDGNYFAVAYGKIVELYQAKASIWKLNQEAGKTQKANAENQMVIEVD